MLDSVIIFVFVFAVAYGSSMIIVMYQVYVSGKPDEHFESYDPIEGFLINMPGYTGDFQSLRRPFRCLAGAIGGSLFVYLQYFWYGFEMDKEQMEWMFILMLLGVIVGTNFFRLVVHLLS